LRVFILGKRPGQPVVAATDCPSPGRRLIIADRDTRHGFLIDTGSEICCFPRRLLKGSFESTGFDLRAANGSTIKTYDYLPLSLNLGLRRTFLWRFLITDVSAPIIGADFLANFNLLPDCRSSRLIDGITGLSVHGADMDTPQVSVRLVDSDSPYAALLADYPDIARPPGTARITRHSTVHYIRTMPGPPVSFRPRRLAPDRLRIAKAEFDVMLADGTARRSDSPWASPLHMVPKKLRTAVPCSTPSTT